MFFSRRAGHQFYDRGDITTHDFELGVFTTNEAWHTISLASIVPVGAKFVWVYVNGAVDAGTGVGRFRKTGHTGTYQFPLFVTYVVGSSSTLVTIIPCNAAREIDYHFSDSSWILIEFNVLGWIK